MDLSKEKNQVQQQLPDMLEGKNISAKLQLQIRKRVFMQEKRFR